MAEDPSKPKLKKRQSLGKGLGALLSDSSVPEQKKQEIASLGSINEIPVGQIAVNPFQPRQDFEEGPLNELAESIRLQGIIQPLTVRKLDDKQYQLISGERRLQASRKAGLEKVPVYIRTANDQQMLELALIENIQRENLNPVEIALSYQRLITECQLKQEELGDRVGKKRATVTNYLRLLKLPPKILAALRDRQISIGHAKPLIALENIDQQIAIFQRILHKNLSVREVEKIVKALTEPARAKTGNNKQLPPEKQQEYDRLQHKLSSHFGTRIKVSADKQEKGEIKIPFQSVDDLNRILELLNF